MPNSESPVCKDASHVILSFVRENNFGVTAFERWFGVGRTFRVAKVSTFHCYR